jgi:CRISPR type I-E-associated protein CasB/Cse2
LNQISNLEWECNRIFYEWWLELAGRAQRGEDQKLIRDAQSRVVDVGPNKAEPKRADRAALRALARDVEIDLVSACQISSFRNLAGRISGATAKAGWSANAEKLDRLVACAACAAAHITELPDQQNSMAYHLAGPLDERLKKDYSPPFAETRMKRLLRASEPEDVLRQMLRAVAVLKRRAPPGDLGASMILWGFLPGVRRRWARDYLKAGMPLPEDASQVKAA